MQDKSQLDQDRKNSEIIRAQMSKRLVATSPSSFTDYHKFTQSIIFILPYFIYGAVQRHLDGEKAGGVVQGGEGFTGFWLCGCEIQEDEAGGS